MQNVDREQDEKRNLDALIGETKAELSSYLEKRLESTKLRIYEKTSISGAYIVYGLLILLMSFFIFFLLLLTLGYFLGELLNSDAAGFGILILISGAILAFFVANGKKFRHRMTNLIISLIRKIEKDEE